MAGIPIISNFDLNSYSPIDSRIIASSSTVREAIIYKYNGLSVYQTDNGLTYVWNGSTWVEELDGIYGGSGSLIGNTNVYSGIVGTTSGSQSNIFSLSSLSGTDYVYQSTIFNKHTTAVANWRTVEVKTQVSHNSSLSSVSYISHNPYDSRGIGYEGGIELGTNNTKRFTITSDGLIRMWGPTYSADFIATSLTGSNSYVLPSKSGTLALLSDTSASPLSNGKIFIGNTSSISEAKTISGDATLSNDGTLTLKNTGSAGAYGSATSVPIFSTDAQGRITGVTMSIIVPVTYGDTVNPVVATTFILNPGVSTFQMINGGVGNVSISGTYSAGHIYKIWNRSGATWSYSGDGLIETDAGVPITTISNGNIHVIEVYGFSGSTVLFVKTN